MASVLEDQAAAAVAASAAAGVPSGIAASAAAGTPSSTAASTDAGGLERAAWLLGLAEATRAAIGTVLAPCERPQHEKSVRAAKAGLGETAYDTAWRRGATASDPDEFHAEGSAPTPTGLGAPPSRPPTAPPPVDAPPSTPPPSAPPPVAPPPVGALPAAPSPARWASSAGPVPAQAPAAPPPAPAAPPRRSRRPAPSRRAPGERARGRHGSAPDPVGFMASPLTGATPMLRLADLLAADRRQRHLHGDAAESVGEPAGQRRRSRPAGPAGTVDRERGGRQPVGAPAGARARPGDGGTRRHRADGRRLGLRQAPRAAFPADHVAAADQGAARAALWPELSAKQLGNALHTALRELRRALGAHDWVALRRPGHYSVNRDRAFDCDVDTFESSLAAAGRVRPARPGSPTCGARSRRTAATSSRDDRGRMGECPP